MMYHFVSGGIMMACLVAGFFFYKFWKKTSDPLFKMFASAFWLLAIERIVLSYVGANNEPRPEIYLIRLSAFLMILIAIIRKNRNA
jgi:hypothetical protein